MIADGADCVLPVRPPKNRVGGRYLATFSSNCFAINENQVAELVAAAILVATSGHPRRRNRTHLGCRLRRRQNALIFSCQRAKLQAAYPWGLAWSHRKLNTCQVFNNSIYIVI